MSQATLLARLTKICLGLPEASADDRHPPHRGFVVNKKNFAWFTINEHSDGRVALGAIGSKLQAPSCLTSLLDDR